MKTCDKCLYKDKKLKIKSLNCISLICSNMTGEWYNLCCRCIRLHESCWDYSKIIIKKSNEFCPHVIYEKI